MLKTYILKNNKNLKKQTVVSKTSISYISQFLTKQIIKTQCLIKKENL